MSKGNRFTEEFRLEAVKQVVERGFGLPSTIRTCGLRLRSCKNELKQLVKQQYKPGQIWCGIDTENLGSGWKPLNLTWYWQAFHGLV